MPSLQDVIDAAELLKVSVMAVDEVRCAPVRNRNSKCHRCAEACISNAITIGQNEIEIDAAECVNCGACVAACPNNAIFALEPTELSVIQKALDAAKTRSTSMICIACQRKNAQHTADESLYSTVPCLAHIGEAQLLKLIGAGANDIVLVDGVCKTCKYGAVSSLINEAISNAAEMLEAANSDAIITRASEFPEEIGNSENFQHKTQRGADRRGLAKQTTTYFKNVASNVAKKAIEERLGTGKPKSLKEKLGVVGTGRLPKFEAERNMEMLDSLSGLYEKEITESGGVQEHGESTAHFYQPITTRYFGNLEINAEKCSGCGLCVMHCPTNALKYAEFDQPEDPEMRYLEFRAADCTQCMLCQDTCLRDCLYIHNEVTLNELFDFEPKLVAIPKPKDSISVLNSRLRAKHGY